jgi:hypothetical protein
MYFGEVLTLLLDEDAGLLGLVQADVRSRIRIGLDEHAARHETLQPLSRTDLTVPDAALGGGMVVGRPAVVRARTALLSARSALLDLTTVHASSVDMPRCAGTPHLPTSYGGGAVPDFFYLPFSR